jgi:hypothetical protein
MFYDDPKVPLPSYDNPIMLDLVAHFLGIATHHNDNCAPSTDAALDVISSTQDI